MDVSGQSDDVPRLKPDNVPPQLCPNDSGSPFPLIMKGGGVKGLAYVGAIDELSKRYRFNWFVGTSAGAITSVLLGAGYTPQELRELMKQKDFRDFFDASWYAKPFNLLFHGGLHNGNALTRWLDQLLAVKLRSNTRVKLSDLPHRVTVYASRRGKRTLKFDSLDNDAEAAYAVRCSMSIPLMFTPQTDQGINTYDGGIHQNYPVEQLLKDHPNTLFISLYLGPEIFEPVSQGLLSDLLSIWTEGTDAEAVSQYRERTVIIDPRPIGTLGYDLSDDEKEFLLACGRAGAHQHLNKDTKECIVAIRTRDDLRKTVTEARSKKRRRIRRITIFLFLIAVTVGLPSGRNAFTNMITAIHTIVKSSLSPKNSERNGALPGNSSGGDFKSKSTAPIDVASDISSGGDFKSESTAALDFNDGNGDGQIDNRVQITQRTSLPYRAVCQIEVKFKSGLDEVGSGFLVSPRLVITTGHVVFNHLKGGFAIEAKISLLDDVDGAVGQEIDVRSDGGTFRTTLEYGQSQEIRSNFGAIMLPRPFDSSQFLKLGETPTDQQLVGKLVTVVGFPIDKPTGSMWSSTGEVTGVLDNYLLKYHAFTGSGTSGGPVLFQNNAIGIHCGVRASDLSDRHALLFTPALRLTVNRWIAIADELVSE